MAKSNAELVREYKARQRARARGSGLCIQCWKAKPGKGRAVCLRCQTLRIERKRRQREKARAIKRTHHIIALHERAGDEASEQHFYHDAIRQFETVLRIPGIEEADRLRIGTKLSLIAYLTGDERLAGSWPALLLGGELDASASKEQRVAMLVKTAMYRWRDCQTKSALPLLAQASELVDAESDPREYFRINIEMAQFLLELGWYREAEQFMEIVRDERARDMQPQIAPMVEGRYLAWAGKMAEAFENFELALHASREIPSRKYNVGEILDKYALAAHSLGDIQLAKACYKRASSSVNKHHMGWQVPFVFLGRADIFMCAGQFTLAYTSLKEAIACNVNVPQVTVRTAYVGIPLALRRNDRELLQQCARTSAIDLAFQAGEDVLIGRTAAAFAGLYRSQGRLHEAQALVHRALGAVRSFASHWDLAIEAATIGSDNDVRHARKLLEDRTGFPSTEVPQAFLALFDAIIAQRRGRLDEARTIAIQAAERFDTLQWHAFADMAKELAGSKPARASLQVHSVVGNDSFHNAVLPMLTSRERQVAALVSKGLTNREIGTSLSISENTVETHMASIMNRCGIRSRHQLIDLLNAG